MGLKYQKVDCTENAMAESSGAMIDEKLWLFMISLWESRPSTRYCHGRMAKLTAGHADGGSFDL